MQLPVDLNQVQTAMQHKRPLQILTCHQRPNYMYMPINANATLRHQGANLLQAIN